MTTDTTIQHTVDLICSNKPRPATHSKRYKSGFYKTGACLWGRDVYHAAGERGKTLCGRKTDGWLNLPPMNTDDAIADSNFCSRCATRLIRNGN